MNTFEQLLKMSTMAKVHITNVKAIHGRKFILKAIKMGVGAYFVNRFNFSKEPRYLMFEITNECNLRCKGCLQGVDNSQQETNQLLSDPRFFQFINSYPNIVVTGGEPLTLGSRQFLFQLLDEHKNGTVTVITNGTMIDEEFANKMANNPKRIVGVSIDGTKEVHDARRGNGSFDKTLKGIELLNKEKVNWIPFVTTTNQNFDDVTSKEFRNLVIELGAYVSLYIPYMPTNCSENRELELSKEQLISLREKIEEFKKYGAKSGNVFLNLFDSEYKLMRGCAVGGKVRYIDYMGNVLPCPFITYSPFNVLKVLEGKRKNLSDRFFDELREISKQHNRECIIRNHPELVLQTYRNYQRGLIRAAKRTDIILKEDEQC